jgi:hypothetical protein
MIPIFENQVGGSEDGAVLTRCIARTNASEILSFDRLNVSILVVNCKVISILSKM